MDDNDTASADVVPDGPVGATATPATRSRRVPDAVLALLMALLIVLLAFPEVVALGGSLSPVGLNGVVNANADVSTVQLYPNITTSTPRDGVQDIGARVWQLVPATKFVHRTLAAHESLSWNPYSASGSLGPETLADLKLSPFVLLVALLGASATAFTFVVLAFAVLALFCLQRFFTRTLGLGRVAAVAACAVFLLSGFAASDINSAVGAPFLLFPVVLYTLAERRRVGGTAQLFAAVAAYAGFILTTFVPVQFLMIVFVHAVAVVVDASLTERGEGESRLRRALDLTRRQLLVPITAIGLTAFAWLPVIDALRHAGGDIASYADRALPTSSSLHMLKVLSPWLANTHLAGATQWVGYVGIAPLVLIAAAFPRAGGNERRLLTVCVVLGGLALALHAGIPGVRSIGNLPGLKSIRGDYWAALAAAGLTIAAGLAVAVIGRRGASPRMATVAGAAIAVAIVAGRHDEPALGAVVALALVAGLIAIARASSHVSRRRALALACLVLIAVELWSYQNHARLSRLDVEKPPPAYITFLQQHLGTGRVLDAGRGALYPEWGAALGIAQIDTLNVMQVPQYRDFYRRFVNPTDNALFLQIGREDDTPFLVRPLALDLLSVRYLVVDQHLTEFDAGVRARYPLAFVDPTAGVRVYRNPGAFANAFLSPALTTQRTGLSFPRLTQTLDPQLLATARAAGIPTDSSAASRTLGTARVANQTNTRVRVAVNATKPAVLVLTDSYYRNWTVRINGHAAHLGRVDSVVRGVVVPRGRSTVTFQYRSRARSIGTLISYSTLIALVLLALVSVVRRRVRGP